MRGMGCFILGHTRISTCGCTWLVVVYMVPAWSMCALAGSVVKLTLLTSYCVNPSPSLVHLDCCDFVTALFMGTFFSSCMIRS